MLRLDGTHRAQRRQSTCRTKMKGQCELALSKLVNEATAADVSRKAASCVHLLLQVGIAARQIELGRVRVSPKLLLCLSGHLVQVRRGELSPPATHDSADAIDRRTSPHHLSRLNSVSVALWVGDTSLSCTNAHSGDPSKGAVCRTVSSESPDSMCEASLPSENASCSFWITKTLGADLRDSSGRPRQLHSLSAARALPHLLAEPWSFPRRTFAWLSARPSPTT